MEIGRRVGIVQAASRRPLGRKDELSARKLFDFNALQTIRHFLGIGA